MAQTFQRIYSRKDQQGIALVVVLLMMAIISAVAIQMTSRTQFAVARNVNLNSYNQAYWFALSAESMAKNLLVQDLNSSENKVHLAQQWANYKEQPLPIAFEDQGVNILVKVDDLQSYYNLNNLHVAKSQSFDEQQEEKGSDKPSKHKLTHKQVIELYKNLLESAGLDEQDAERLRDLLVDYIDDDQNVSEMGAENESYLAKKLPYITRSGLLNDRSELRAVIGYNQRIFHGLKYYVWALPSEQTKINVNTIDEKHAPLMRALLNNQVSIGDAKSIISKRPNEGWDTFEDFAKDARNIANNVPSGLNKIVDVKSQYFLLHIEVIIEERVFKLDSVLYYEKNKPMEILSRQFGGQA